jgi:hypothetical protein
MSFSDDVDYWLAELRLRCWTLHLGGRDSRRPEWIAAHYAWENCADVVILRGESSATAFRAPADHETDVLAPDWVTWVYSHNAVWTLRAVLTIARPGSTNEPVHLMTAPAACRIPLHGRRPVTIRPLGRP